MKILGLVTVFCVTVSVVACGGDSSSGQPEPEAAKLTKPDVEFPPGPFPKELVIDDLEEGSGPSSSLGDKLTLHYLAVNKTGKVLYNSWDERQFPLVYTRDGEAYFESWEEGVEGMKVGGRRELLVPGHLGLGEPLVYVIDLLKIE